MTTAAITGCSGLLGGNLAALLCADGVTVRATRRRSTNAEHLRDLPIQWMDADLDDKEGLARAFTGADVVFHCAAVPTQTHFAGGQHHAANVVGTQNVIEAVKKAGATRLVHTSSVVACAIAKDGAPDVTEDEPWNYGEYGLDEMYSRTKHVSEQAVVRAANAGEIDAVVVNPGLMIGPRDSKPSGGRLILELKSRRIAVNASGTGNFVDVRDVCRGMIAAWKRGRGGERYILGGVNLPFKEAFALICSELGIRPPLITVPDKVVLIAGEAGDASERLLGREMVLNSAISAYSVCKGYRFSSAKAERELGYTISPLRTAVHDAIIWFRAHGKL